MNSMEKFKESHEYRGERLRDFVFGFSDGMVTTLAIISALSGAGLNNIIIIFAGIANVLGDGISMALGGYISSKSEIDVYKNAERQEKKEMEMIPDVERDEIRQIYRQKGFRGKLLEDIVKKITSNKKLWLDEMMREELGLSKNALTGNPSVVAATIFIGFLIAGFIPLIPYAFFDVQMALAVALPLSFATLFVMGGLRSIFTGRNWFRSGLEVLVIGMLATSAAYFVGSLIPHY